MYKHLIDFSNLKVYYLKFKSLHLQFLTSVRAFSHLLQGRKKTTFMYSIYYQLTTSGPTPTKIVVANINLIKE